MEQKTKDIVKLREMTGAGIMDVKKALDHAKGDFDMAIKYLREKGITNASKKADRIAAEGLTTVLVKENDAIIVEFNCETDFVAKNKEFVKLLEQITSTLVVNKPKDLKHAHLVKIDNVTIENLIKEKTTIIGEKLSLRRFQIISKSNNEEFGSYIHMGGKISVLVKAQGLTKVEAKDIAMHIAAMNPTYLTKEEISQEEISFEKQVIEKQFKDDKKPPEIKAKILSGKLDKVLGERTLLGQSFIKDPSKKISVLLSEKNAKILTMLRFEVGEGLDKKKDNFVDEVMSQIKK